MEFENLEFYDLPCWNRQQCGYHSEEKDCRKSCPYKFYTPMNYMISNCGVPDAEAYMIKLQPGNNKDVEAFKRLQNIKDNIFDYVNSHNSIYITSSSTGTGKTTWALKMMYKYFNDVYPSNGFNARGRFIYVPRFLYDAKYLNGRSSKKYKLLEEMLDTLDIIIWDDIASTKLTSTDQLDLLAFIGKRAIHHQFNIFTGNIVEKEQLTEVVGGRLADIIYADEVVKFTTTKTFRGSK